ncbi:hypothetical protein [Levilactobacillus suantsaii]|uniref:Uncharacterized protein n=1 Tax=Levilactobacillus suantsaii TaxID=2292255 RepID=A0A4V1LFF0_9LACO|nr:hypothetical protein [Levilactobacillus suantsaii]QMU08773.1 hypothetical protein H3M12_03690 [Levilactobacillus suantsaii]RXI78944.1 hypothetical protein DXH47_05385 [Levilactobacillus suantsaii]
MGIYKPIFILTLTISFALLGGGPAQAATTTTSRNAALTQLHHQAATSASLSTVILPTGLINQNTP